MINVNHYINVLPCFKLGERSDIIRISILSRLFLVLWQYFSNLAIKDHDANVFLYPRSDGPTTLLDAVVQHFFSGFVRWDAQYFMHIAKYGYTYENILAFFPLYPLITKLLSNLLSPFLPLLNEDSIIMIMFVAFNIFLFVGATLVLYNLTSEILGRKLAYRAAILFCINPASVFFSAPYTESLFAYLTFKCMLHLYRTTLRMNYKNIIIGVFYISLSMCTRSNGILNVGFLAYYYVKSIAKSFNRNNFTLMFLKHGILLTYFIVLCFVPFALIQSYNYFMFCKDLHIEMPDFILNHAKENGFVLPGNYTRYRQEWCEYSLPLSYNYIQKRYWNVGFLRYYELKQIPNFLLALPIIYIVTLNCLCYFREHKAYSLGLGIFNVRKTKQIAYYEREMFVYVCHALFLTIFCVFCIHIQVTTRLLCSASPALYWFAAYYYDTFNVKQKIFLLDRTITKMQTFIKYYFISYYLIGTFMFCNFLPWT